MKCVFILFLLSFSLYSFDKIIDADNGEQVVLMKGHDGTSGSDGWCSEEDDSDSGDRGGDGQDAGEVLIKYTSLDQLKNIKVISDPGEGGDGGDGCGTGTNGSDGIDGDHAVIYLFDKRHGKFSFSKNKLTISNEFTAKKIVFTKNKYSKHSNVRHLLMEGSNPQQVYFQFKEKMQKELEIINQIKDLPRPFDIFYDFENEFIRYSSLVLLSYDESSANVVFKRYVDLKQIELKKIKLHKEDGMKFLIFDDLAKKYNLQVKQEYQLQLYENYGWPLGFVPVQEFKIPEFYIIHRDGKVLLRYDHLNIRKEMRPFKKRYMGVKLYFENSGGRISKDFMAKIRVRR